MRSPPSSSTTCLLRHRGHKAAYADTMPVFELKVLGSCRVRRQLIGFSDQLGLLQPLVLVHGALPQADVTVSVGELSYGSSVLTPDPQRGLCGLRVGSPLWLHGLRCCLQADTKDELLPAAQDDKRVEGMGQGPSGVLAL